ncbi:MAG: hypothetical protein DRO06_02155 [Thermoproteota archaeon]|nr:MAG: hypothetical protein DRO06_02155 [Candidatus Korarchaeota archaeon]
MDRAALASAALAASLVSIPLASAQPYALSAIVVRGDIYADWTVATAYGMHANIPVLSLMPNVNEEEILGLLSTLSAEGGRVLIVGDTLAVPLEFEYSLESMGVMVDRLGGPTRAETSVMLATQLWRDCESIVVVEGTRRDLYLQAIILSTQNEAPIVYSSSGLLPSSFWGAMDAGYFSNLNRVLVLSGSLSEEEISQLEARGLEVVALSASGGTLEESSLRAIYRILSSPELYAGLLLGAVGSYLILRRRFRRPLSIPLSFLTPDERKIVKIVIERGEVTQDALPELTGFSKPKVSRLIQELMDRGLLVRERSGKTYTIRLNKVFKAD